MNSEYINKIKSILYKDIGPTRIDSRILSLFLKQLSLLLGSGLAIDTSLRIIEAQNIDKKLSKALAEINVDLSRGDSINEAFSKRSKYFDPMILAFIRSGDQSGKLSEVLADLSIYIEEDGKNKASMKQAMTYPIILLVVTIIIVSIVIAFVLPTFEQVFEGTGQSLPKSTRFLIGFSSFWADFGLWILVIILFIVLSILILRRDDDFRYGYDKFSFLRLPFKRYRILKLEYQFSSLLHILRAGDINILDAISIIRNSFKNTYIQTIFDDITNDLTNGISLSSSLKARDIFSPLFISMVEIGEDSSQMVEALEKSSEFYSNEYIFRLKRLSQLLEPLMVIIMSLIVAFVVFSIAIPIFDSVNSVSF